MSNIPVCKLCMEPLSNFLCPGCLYKAVQQWIWKCSPSLIDGFSHFHSKFTETLSSEKTARCVACKNDYYHMICPYDYIKEVHAWISSLIPEKPLKEFLIIFGMGFRRIDRHLRSPAFYRNGGPAMLSGEKQDTGICESCENFSDCLVKDSSGRIVCDRCR